MTQPGLTHPSLQAPPAPRTHQALTISSGCSATSPAQRNPSSSFSACIPSLLLGLPHLSFHKDNHLGLHHEAIGKKCLQPCVWKTHIVHLPSNTSHQCEDRGELIILLSWNPVILNDRVLVDKMRAFWTCLVVQWFRLCASTAGGTGLIPG